MLITNVCLYQRFFLSHFVWRGRGAYPHNKDIVISGMLITGVICTSSVYRSAMVICFREFASAEKVKASSHQKSVVIMGELV